MNEESNMGESTEVRCRECNTVLPEGMDREVTTEGTFCRPCYNNLLFQVQQAVEEQGSGINYPMAAVGGVLGGVVGALAWWGFTVATNIAFGLVAIVIGFTVGKGIVWLSGNKRGQGLQIMSVALSALSYFFASYLVNRTFILRAMAEEGMEGELPILPDPALFFEVVKIGFEFFDLIFLAIVVYQAWQIPAPVKLGTPAASNE